MELSFDTITQSHSKMSLFGRHRSIFFFIFHGKNIQWSRSIILFGGIRLHYITLGIASVSVLRWRGSLWICYYSFDLSFHNTRLFSSHPTMNLIQNLLTGCRGPRTSWFTWGGALSMEVHAQEWECWDFKNKNKRWQWFHLVKL